ncbi:prepilin peptidase [Jatrophihabitans fulvus]
MIPLWFVAALTTLLGLLVGSFLNVVIHRVPRGESVVSPPSHCPRCDAGIKGRHNVPVLGWLVLRGRCASCALPISARYPLVEAATGVLFGALTLLVGLSAALPGLLVLAAVGVTLALVTADGQRLPPRFVATSAVVIAVLLVPVPLLSA